MRYQEICQVVDTLAPGSAVSNCLLATQDILHSHNYEASVRARISLGGMNQRKRSPRIARRGKRLVVYHFSVGSAMTRWIERRSQREDVVLWYHNLTPAHYFAATNPFLAGRLVAGRHELRRLASVCRGALADSEFNAGELRSLGYTDVQVVHPVFLNGRYEIPPTPSVMAQHTEGGGTWLFVGRLVPNKRQDEIIVAFHAFRQLVPEARLFLVGTGGSSVTYRRWLENQIAYLGLGSSVHLVGHVSQADVNAYYQIADCFVSMSEHEGFGVPLVESMHFGVPVIAYAAAAVSETMSGAGILIRERHPFLVAEIAYLLREDATLRQAVLASQGRRLAEFSLEANSRRLLDAIAWFERQAG